jgi:hypothetical protein
MLVWDEHTTSLMGDETLGVCKFKISALKEGKNELTLDFPEIKGQKPRIFMTAEVVTAPKE